MPFTGTPTPVGRKCKLLINTGSRASPVWVEAKKTPGVKVALSKKLAALETRESPWDKKLAANKEFKITFDYIKTKGIADALWDILHASYWTDDPVEFAVVDGAIADAGASGWRAFMLCGKLDRDEELAKTVTHSLEFELTEYYEAGALCEPLAIDVAE